MTWLRLGVALMLVGLVLRATGTYSAISLDAERGFGFGAPADDLDDKDDNYFDTMDRPDPDTTIGNWGTSVLRVYNQFGQSVTANEVRVTEIEPVNTSTNDTTTDRSAVQVNQDSFSAGRTLDPENEAPIRLQCDDDYTETVRGKHEITVSTVVEGNDSGTVISLDRTITADAECN